MPGQIQNPLIGATENAIIIKLRYLNNFKEFKRTF